MHDDDCEQGCDGRHIDLPGIAALYQTNRDDEPTILALFREVEDGKKYLDDFRSLDEDEFVTLVTSCGNDPGLFHILSCIYNPNMHIVEVDGGVLRSVPKEMAPLYGDKWVTKEGE